MEGMDLSKLSETLAQMQEMIDSIRAMLPSETTSAVQEEAAIDEATADAEMEAADPATAKPSSDAKSLKKAAIMRIMAKE